MASKSWFDSNHEEEVAEQIHVDVSDALTTLSAPQASDFQKHEAWKTLKDLGITPGE